MLSRGLRSLGRYLQYMRKDTRESHPTILGLFYVLHSGEIHVA